jgi:hypothetical protein
MKAQESLESLSDIGEGDIAGSPWEQQKLHRMSWTPA